MILFFSVRSRIFKGCNKGSFEATLQKKYFYFFKSIFKKYRQKRINPNDRILRYKIKKYYFSFFRLEINQK